MNENLIYALFFCTQLHVHVHLHLQVIHVVILVLSTCCCNFRYGIEMDMSRPSFNAGVLGINLDKWRRKNVTKEVIFWMSENRKRGLWQLGTQPLVYVIGYGDWEFV